MTRTNQEFTGEQTLSYARRRLLQWMRPVLEQGTELSENVLAGLGWALGGLDGSVDALTARLARQSGPGHPVV